ncbi:nonstructural polyprotein [Bat hepatitis E virus]|uniref:Nonstructural polyprotein n=1 Tax=horseshoe bat hepatitis E virus TaxID=3070190 RepID=A0AAC8LTZ7_9VIRU|nr:nonstructural polyprotein [Bat hepatitis E virus]AIF74285.1 nonstructural polyprotein [horseshoe bat hepatitis E virus]
MDVSQWAAPKGAANAIEAAALAATASAIDHALLVECYLTKTQTEVLIGLFAPMQLRFEPKTCWSHPLQRFIHNYLEVLARRKAGPRYLEVGAHPRSINNNPAVVHRCFLPLRGRDRQRWNSAPRRGLANAIRRGLLCGRSSNEFCSVGFHNCDFKSEIAVACYSLHDLSPREVACAMYKHGVRTLYAALHLPFECLLPDGVYQTKSYHVLQREGATIVTYVGDTSAGYRHKTSILREWLQTTQVTGRHPVIIERVRAVGCHFLLCITATHCEPMPYSPFPNSDYVYVLDIYGPGFEGGVFSGGTHTYHAVPLDIWRRLMMFGETLDDDAFCCSRMQTYLRGISHKVTVGNVVANTGWQPDERSLTATITAAYLTIAHQRWLRTQGISKGVQRLKKEHVQGFFHRLLEWLTPCLRQAGVGFYRQLKHWLSAGLVRNPQAEVFDDCRRCACPVVRRVHGEECWVPSPWGNLRYVDSTPKPIKAVKMVERPSQPVLAPVKKIHPRVASTVYPGLQLPEELAVELEESLWEDGRYYYVMPCPIELIPATVRVCAGGNRIAPRVSARKLFVKVGGNVSQEDVTIGYDSGKRRYYAVVGDRQIFFDSFTPFSHDNNFELPGGYQISTERPDQGLGHAGAEILLDLPDGSQILCGDLFGSKCDWLVNAANGDHLPGGGICGQFHRRYPDLFPVQGRRHGRVIFQEEPVKVIHAVAPDYRVSERPDLLEATYRDAMDRTGTAAYPVLGAGIYQVPYMLSVSAWLRHHRPGDALYIHPADRHRYLGVDVKTPNQINITESMAAKANLALSLEKEPYKKFVDGVTVLAGTVYYDYITGVPGSGKSRSVPNDGQLVVAPTKKLVADWRDRGFEAYTPHKSLTKVTGRDCVYDEAPTLPPHLLLSCMQLASSNLLLGDPRQIPALDFQHTGLVDPLRLPLVPSEHWTVSHRCPYDVCRFLAADYPGITTTSQVRRSLFWGRPSVGQIIVFTQAAKGCYEGSITVHESQGSTFDQTTIIATLDARGLIASSRAHAIVAITRHTKACHVIDQGGLLAEVGLTDAMITMLLAQELAVTPTPVVEPVRIPRVGGQPALPHTHTDVAATLTAEALGHQPTEVAAVVPACPALQQGLLFMPDRLDGKDDVIVTRLSDTVHCRLLAPADRLSVVSTLVGRYGKFTLTPKDDFDLRRLSWFIPDLSGCKPTEVEYMQLVQAMTSKGQTGELVLELTGDNKDCYRITFFQKDCNKFTLEDPVQHGKVGQGISAWPKTLCALFGPWFRAIEKRIVSALPPGWFYADLYTEADLHAHCIAVPPGTQVFENDFSEFDSTQNNVSLDFECQLLSECGMPEWMVRLYWLQRAYWTLVAPNAALRGCWKKHSGEPGTLLFNTVWNMVVVNVCYEFRGDVVHVYKGDDSVVLCQDAQLRDGGQHLVTACGLKLKQNFGPIGCFSNYIIAPGAGCCKDLLRTWGRMTEKNFSSSGRAHDLTVAAQDFCNAVVAEGKEFLTIEINAAYYGQPRGFFEVVWGAIQSVARGEMGLTDYRLPILRVEGDQ